MFLLLLLAFVLLMSFGMVVFRGSPYVPSHSLQVKKAFGWDSAPTAWRKLSPCCMQALDSRVLAATVGADRF